MPFARITVTAVTDEGHHVIVRGTAEHSTESVGFTFLAKGDDADLVLAERASRLTAGAEVAIEYALVVDGWSLAHDLTVLPVDE